MEKNKCKIIGRMKNNKGITLLALAVTIVVLLILTSIGIKLALGNNGIIGEAKNAKEQAEIDEEKGIVKRATTVSLIKSKGSKVEQDTLEKALNDETGEGKTEVNDVGDVFEVVFVDSNRYYEVDEEGNISDVNKITKDNYAGDITKGGRCDGSEEKPYEISCIEDLVALSNIVNGEGVRLNKGDVEAVTTADRNNLLGKNFILTRNLNFKSKFSYSDSTRTDFGDLNGDDTDGNKLMTEMTTGTGFTSIGYMDIKQFKGIFDGKNNSINNIYINNTKHSQANGGEGLFGLAYESKIMNLKISGEINGGVERTGGIVGFTKGNVKIANCENRCNMKSNNHIGGIVADEYGKLIIVNSANYGKEEGTTTGDAAIGGIIGFINAETNIINCYNQGELISDFTRETIGGIVGHTGSSIANVYNCYNVGKITSKGGEGAIIGGYWYNEWISNLKACYYLKNCSKYVIGKVGTTQEFDAIECTKQEMQSTEIINKLNEYVENYNQENKDNEDFIELKYWKKGENGYPTFEE